MQIRRSGKRVKSIEERTVEERAVAVWGVDAQLRQAQEELAELIAAINRFSRGRSSASSVIEEIADVEIMCFQLRLLFGGEAIERAKHQKKLRLLERVERAEKLPQKYLEEDRWAKRMIELEGKIEVVRKAIGP